ncbi:hypothetical protein D9M72_559130 [compost metagenome]
MSGARGRDFGRLGVSQCAYRLAELVHVGVESSFVLGNLFTADDSSGRIQLPRGPLGLGKLAVFMLLEAASRGLDACSAGGQAQFGVARPARVG